MPSCNAQVLRSSPHRPVTDRRRVGAHVPGATYGDFVNEMQHRLDAVFVALRLLERLRQMLKFANPRGKLAACAGRSFDWKVE